MTHITTLHQVCNDLSPLQNYLVDPQRHERIATGVSPSEINSENVSMPVESASA